MALSSFIIGTCLLSFYLYFGESFIPLGLAIGVVVFATIANSIMFSVIVGSAILNKTHRHDALKTCGVMLLNIPIAILYFYIVITFPSQHLLI